MESERNDAEMERLKARLLLHMPKEFDITLVTLKGHLLMEEHLDHLLYSLCAHPAVLKKERISFELKLKFVRAMTGDSGFESDPPWEALAALNKIRNSLAHKVEDPKFDGYVTEFMRLAEKAGSSADPNAPIDVRYGGALGYLMGLLAGMAMTPDRTKKNEA